MGLLLAVSLLVVALDPDAEVVPSPQQQPIEYRVSTVVSPAVVVDQVVAPPSSPPPIQEVFVPLQKWKEQKLQDIESRVKRDEAVLKRKRKRNRERVAYHGKLLSRRQMLFRQMFSRICVIHDELSNVSVAYGGGENVEKPAATTVVVLESPSKAAVIESPEVPVASAVDVVRKDEKHVPPLSNDRNDESGPSPALETPHPVEHSKVATTHRATPEVTSENSETPNIATSYPDLQSPTLSVASTEEDSDENASTPLLKKIEKKVRSIRDTVTTAVNLSQNSAKVRNLRESISVTINLSQNEDGCANCSGNSTKNDAPLPPKLTEATKAPDAEIPRDHVRKGPDGGDDLADADKAPVNVKRTLFNFASEGAGAQILASSPNTVGAKNIITENSDKYMLVPCVGKDVGGSRWVDIELSEYAFLTSVQTANFELYSSTARKFAVLGSENYPPKQWNVLGVYDFEDTRAVQTFVITAPSRKVTRFLRVVFVGRHGNEYYCPISIFRAFGKNLIADLKDGLETPMSKPAESSAIQKEEVKIKGPASDNMVERDGEGSDKEEKRNPPVEAHNDMGRRDSAQEAGEPQQAKGEESAEVDASASRKGTAELSSDDQILLNVVREETLSPVSGDDNIFRRVARMIRLLELNQSLTNQYIDTHLARFADALSATQSEAARARKGADVSQARVAGLAVQLERAIVDMHAATLRRDMLMGALMICIGFLLGTHWVMWTALSVRAAGSSDDVTSPVSSPETSAVTGNDENELEREPKGRIVHTVSVDGVHVQMTDVRPRRRKKRRGDTQTTPSVAVNSPQSARSAGGRVGLPPIGVSPSKMKPLLTRNSFQPLCPASAGEHEKFTPRNT